MLRFPSLADFEVSGDGTMVQVWPAEGLSAPTLEHLYLNQVLPLALSRQGKLVLHGSAISLSLGAVAFLGRSGRGKSTLAASFAARGSAFLTDDSLLLEKTDAGYMVQPAHPSIRLWDDSREALIAKSAVIAPSIQYAPKSRVLSDDSLPFCEAARPLRHIYFLGDRNATEVLIEPLRPVEALIELVNNSFMLDIETPAVIAEHFSELIQLVNEPIYFRLDYPRDYQYLPRVVQAIEKHAQASTANESV
ncbi:MAG: hypothetical protein V4684_08285 [Pseudomonadota bacterium]